MIRAGLLAAITIVPAAAAEHPPTTPQRDVDVTYEMTQPVEGAPKLTQRMRWSVAAGRLRVDPPTPGLYMIVDYRTKSMSVVKLAERAILDMPTAGQGLPGAAAGAYVERERSEVAGLPCTVWQTTDGAGQQTMLCLTTDGVMLRASQSGHVLLVASGVSYGPQDPAAFTTPSGFQHYSPNSP